MNEEQIQKIGEIFKSLEKEVVIPANVINTIWFDEVSSSVSVNTDTTEINTEVYYPTSNPFENLANLLKGNPMQEMNLESVVPSNRTLVMVHQPETVTSEFKERSARLIGSLNMADTIKAVVVTVNGSKIYSGLHLDQPFDDGELSEEVLEEVRNRFVQVVDVRHGS